MIPLLSPWPKVSVKHLFLYLSLRSSLCSSTFRTSGKAECRWRPWLPYWYLPTKNSSRTTRYKASYPTQRLISSPNPSDFPQEFRSSIQTKRNKLLSSKPFLCLFDLPFLLISQGFYADYLLVVYLVDQILGIKESFAILLIWNGSSLSPQCALPMGLWREKSFLNQDDCS